MTRSLRRGPASRRASAKALKPADAEATLRAAFQAAKLAAIDDAADAPSLAAGFLRTVADLLPGRSIAIRLVE